MSKFDRHGAILRLVRTQHLATQAELAEALRAEGYEAVQTTISRDIAQLGLVKVRNGDGRLVYGVPSQADLTRAGELAAALRRWTLALNATGNLVVVLTPSGYASALAQAIDDSNHPDVAGTIAGDNTIFVAAREGVTGAERAQTVAVPPPGRGVDEPSARRAHLHEAEVGEVSGHRRLNDVVAGVAERRGDLGLRGKRPLADQAEDGVLSLQSAHAQP